jgi:hypothetical protein
MLFMSEPLHCDICVISARIFALTLALSVTVSGLTMAQDALVLVKDSEVDDSEPKLDVSALQDRTVWIGNAKGQTMSSKMLRLDLDDDDLALHPTTGYGTYLGYTQAAEFMKLLDRTITRGALKDETARYLRERGANAAKPIAVTILAEVDLDGDGRSETLIEAHTDRPSDVLDGEPGDAEALLVADTSQRVTAGLINLVSDGGEADRARIIFLVEGLATNPFTGTWDMLVLQKRKYRGRPFSMSVTINGQKMEGPESAFITETRTQVYRYAGGTLVPSDHLGSVSQSFCEESPCE